MTIETIRKEAARQEYLEGKYSSIRLAAAAHDLDHRTLTRYISKCENPTTSVPNHNAHLNDAQDEALVCQMRRLIRWNVNPTYNMIRAYANRILRDAFDPTIDPGAEPPTVGINWPVRWLERHPEFESDWSKPMDNKRMVMQEKDLIAHWFQLYFDIRADYGIHDDDIHNMDESGFQMGVGKRCKVIKFRGTKTPKVKDPKNMSNATLLECISASWRSWDPLVCCCGKLTLTNHIADLLDNYTFGVSDNGWTTDAIGQWWLENIFHPQTWESKKGVYRLLILDGHGSHQNVEFLTFCEKWYIVPLFLPPHTTHILQPLDVGCFQPLKHHHA
jgi:hypothetical protein